MSLVTRTIHTGFTVCNIESMSLFFRECLGLDVSEPRSPPRADVLPVVTGVAGAQAKIAMVTLPGHVIELLEYMTPGSATPCAARPCDIGFAHIAIEVRDVPAVIGAAADYGFAIGGSIYCADGGPFSGRQVAYIRDQLGFTIELVGPQIAGTAPGRPPAE